MIYYINGILESVTDDAVIIDVDGVGYQVFVSNITKSTLPNVGEILKVYTFHYVREDQQLLFGFPNLEEKNLYLLLTTVSGVGPKLAMKVMSAIDAQMLVQAILSENLQIINGIPGIGKKMAEKILIELKDKLHKVYDISKFSTETNTNLSSSKVFANSINKELENDLSLALKTLGYSNDEIKKALARSAEKLVDNLSLEQGLKVILKHL
jgi:holliday junction DNA helicase RuvA